MSDPNPSYSSRRAAGAVAISAGLLLAVTAAAPPASAVEPVDGEEVLRADVVGGVQIYECVAGAYKFVRPRALLEGEVDGRTVLLDHSSVVTDEGRRPSWEIVLPGGDDSKVRVSQVVEATDSPNGPGNIPELSLLVAQIGGEGLLDDVDAILRLDTVGGVAPAGSCSDGQIAYVPYTAEYVFIDTDG
jgi:hypothetical protein